MRACCAEEDRNQIVSKEEQNMQTCESRRARSKSARNPPRIRGGMILLINFLVPLAHFLVPLAHFVVPLAHLFCLAVLCEHHLTISQVPLAHFFCPAVLCEHHLTIPQGPLAHLSDQVAGLEIDARVV